MGSFTVIYAIILYLLWTCYLLVQFFHIRTQKILQKRLHKSNSLRLNSKNRSVKKYIHKIESKKRKKPYWFQKFLAENPIYLFLICANLLPLFFLNYLDLPLEWIFVFVFVDLIIWYIVISFIAYRKNAALLESLPECIEKIQRNIASGQTLIATVHQLSLGDQYISSIFREIYQKYLTGERLRVLLEQSTEKHQNIEFSFMMSVLIIQYETGGNSTEALYNLAEILRKKKLLRQKITSSSAESKITTGVLSGLPILLVIVLYIFTPEYILNVIHSTKGLRLLMYAVIFQCMGVIWMAKMMRINL